MIAYFPEAYPDEILYSICARFHDRMSYPCVSSTIEELFGKNNILLSIDLPDRLNHLVEVLPPGSSYRVKNLINNHTLLPFYSPFCPPERVKRILEEMFTHKTKTLPLHLHLGLGNGTKQEFIQFCPLCAQEDKEIFGEYYWHRLHQIPGVEVCPVHNVFLENTSIPYRPKKTMLISAEKFIQPISIRFLDLSNPDHITILKIARDAAWLLQQRQLSSGFVFIRKRYAKIMADYGLATYKGTLYRNKLLTAFKSYYSPELLKKLNCGGNEQSSKYWLFCLVQASFERVQCPIRHLLFINFLGYTAEQFFNIPDELLEPFGKEAWPCLNPVCEYFKQPSIEKIFITYNEEKKKPIGTFSCSCGFTYCRTGPDDDMRDRFLFSKVKSYGSLWETELKNLWANPQVSIDEIATILGIKHKITIQRQATRLGLPITRFNLSPNSIENISVSNNYNLTKYNLLKAYRDNWLFIINDNPNLSRTELMNKFQGVHKWLRENDIEWLENHMPFRKKRENLQQPHLNWSIRDLEWATLIMNEAECIKKLSGQPIRISKSRLCNKFYGKRYLQKNAIKLPLTLITLDKVTETQEEFSIRKIQWAAEFFRQENICPQRQQLVKKAKLGTDMEQIEQVQKAIASALASLESLPKQ
jgi:hypothetical protein